MDTRRSESQSPTPPGSPIGRHRSISEGLAEDLNVQATNDDATLCKRCAVQLGYWVDPYIEYFSPALPLQCDRKPPEINRGYWARVRAVRNIIDQFLKIAGPDSQILSIGAGYDTTYWLLKDEGAQFANYTEIDFPEVTSKKIHTITKMRTPFANRLTTDSSLGVSPARDVQHVDYHTTRYHLVGGDLRSTKELKAKLQSAGLKPEAPTLILCECVLIYMAADQSAKLLTTFALMFPTAVFVNYEQVNIDDKFGHIMQDNLHFRGVCLAGVAPCSSLDSQKTRFLDTGWKESKGWNMNDIYNRIPKAEKDRIEKIEFLDEFELLTQLLHHYCIVLGINDAGQIGLNLNSIDL